MNNTENYISPVVEIIEGQTLNIICVSGTTNENYNNENGEDWF